MMSINVASTVRWHNVLQRKYRSNVINLNNDISSTFGKSALAMPVGVMFLIHLLQQWALLQCNVRPHSYISYHRIRWSKSRRNVFTTSLSVFHPTEMVIGAGNHCCWWLIIPISDSWYCSFSRIVDKRLGQLITFATTISYRLVFE
jgi:hypothetical protein